MGRVRKLASILSWLGCALAARPVAAATRVACVGDSITFGAGASAGNSYPSVLGRLLGAEFGVMNFGDSGSTAMKQPSTSYWKTPAFTASTRSAPDVVIIMLGTNDSKTALWRMGNNAFAADYRALIAEYAALPSKPRIHVVLPPPALSPSFTIDGAVIEQEIVPLLRKIAAETGSGLIDVFGAFEPDPRQYFGRGGTDIGDGVHPNDAGAKRIAETVFRALTMATADAGMLAPADAGPDALPESTDGAPAVDALPAADGRAPDGGSGGNQPDAAKQADARPRVDPPAGEDPAPPGPSKNAAASGCHCSAARRTASPGSSALFWVAAVAALTVRRQRPGKRL